MSKVARQISAGRTSSEGFHYMASSSSESTWVRIGGEATVGLVF